MSTSAELRQQFLDFFKKEGHTLVPSSPLVPHNDPTLLFTNAGMVQFKDIFLGREKQSYVRAATVQRCVRAGGKHNDLENVGYTTRHHTFFEMLGNFSFGDYFKREAIHYAWSFLVGTLHIPPERLWITVFEKDDEAANIWLHEIKVNPDQFRRLGKESNFWAMGDTGPCGPCSEIFYDHGPSIQGGPPGSPDEDGDRYVEVWNLVFMQYERNQQGVLTPLPKPSVDTGMGLERLTAVMQGVSDNYHIDIFQNLLKAASQIVGVSQDKHNSLRVLADHIRSTAFLITDGVFPSNEGRGYVLRRIIRRALRHGHKLGVRQAFFHQLVQPLIQEMGQAYPELVQAQREVERTLLLEEERFAETLDQGLKHLEAEFSHLHGNEIPGRLAFKLYDTYGFPVDLTADIAREHGFTLDLQGFETAMEEQRYRAREASRFNQEAMGEWDGETTTSFTGYQQLCSEGRVLAIQKDGQSSPHLHEGETGMIILDQTPFYAESGGQAGDRGELRNESAVFQVTDTRKQANRWIHIGRLLHGTLQVDTRMSAQVDDHLRQATARHHSATHLLHAALRQVLGRHVTQKGSSVDSQRLRFDFSHPEAITAAQLEQIERLVNQHILANRPVATLETSYDQAVQMGAMALFGEKYGDQVRLVSVGEFSRELCGGTHVGASGEIGLFKIVSESAVAAGVRRIEALTGEAAYTWVLQLEQQLGKVAHRLKAAPHEVEERLSQWLEKYHLLETELEQVKDRMASHQGNDLVQSVQKIGNISILAQQIDTADPKRMRTLIDQLREKLGSSVVVLGAIDGDKVRLAAGVTSDLTSRLRAGDLIQSLAQQVGGKGGGKADFAQAGGSEPQALTKVLHSVMVWVTSQLG